MPDYPRPGVTFQDVTPVFQDARLLRDLVDQVADFARPYKPDVVAAVDARGFVLGGALAHALGCGIVLLRKKGRLPRATYEISVTSEYNSETLEIHRDAFHGPARRVLLHDDVLAVGGCSSGCTSLIERAGGMVVAAAFILEIAALDGRAQLGQIPVHSAAQC
ncbi:MAG: adenine phosphoribosyltransferase [Actinomycetota bacterium]|nr:adenine phosphoribosyltransferase [Actinomycetota bacterium]